MPRQKLLIAVLLAGTGLTTPLKAADTQLLWGDTHLHSSYSTDAFIAGNRSADPDTAYRVAKGEPVIHPYNRTRVQLRRPLDFLVVADHAESLGVIGELYRDNPAQARSWFWQRWITGYALGQLREQIAEPGALTDVVSQFAPHVINPGDTADPIVAGEPASLTISDRVMVPADVAERISASMWTKSVTAAEAHYEPGVFTPLIGWEWTQTNNGVNLHRVVVSTLNGEQAATIDPIGSGEAPYPHQLWEGLAELEAETGARFLAIPHNSNLSKGYMFSATRLTGEPITAEFARTRAEWEPIVEVTQIKGDSETHPVLSPDDEFADFEPFNFYLQNKPQGPSYKPAVGDFMRSGLRRGLEIEQEIGVNPYQFGVIGSTDAHTSIPSAEEPNFWGKMATDSIPENKRYEGVLENEYTLGVETFDGWNYSAQGLAAVWATENTREAIFEAFTRRETYATTGPRMTLRVFGGWNYEPAAAEAVDLADVGYAGGVPMGGDVTGAPEDKAFQLLIRATKDPLDANLDRVQVIKGWVDADGTSHERIFDVAWSDGRVPGADGKLPPVGNTVDLSTGAVENSIGAAQFSTLWTDPTFNASQRAFYYVRVLQIPTIRHSQLDAVALGQKTPFEGPATLQERAYSSPIWYTP
ncbi:MAG: DUF3604 domain-containing protein [Parvibaculaceae bacterium]